MRQENRRSMRPFGKSAKKPVLPISNSSGANASWTLVLTIAARLHATIWPGRIRSRSKWALRPNWAARNTTNIAGSVLTRLSIYRRLVCAWSCNGPSIHRNLVGDRPRDRPPRPTAILRDSRICQDCTAVYRVSNSIQNVLVQP